MSKQTARAPSETSRGARERLARLEADLKIANEEREACHVVIEQIVRAATAGEEVTVIDRWGDSVTLTQRGLNAMGDTQEGRE